MIAEVAATRTQHADPMIPTLYRVERMRRDTLDTFSIDIVPANGEPPPPFAPGQFNMLYMFGVGEVPISISCDPANGSRWIEVRGRVVEMTATGAEAHADKLTQRYTGKAHFYGDIYPVEQRAQETRVIVRVAPDKIACDAVFG